jgi:hypothetical protein
MNIHWSIYQQAQIGCAVWLIGSVMAAKAVWVGASYAMRGAR